VRLCALVDLPIVAWLAVPGLAPWLLWLVYGLDSAFGLGSAAPVIPPIAWLFVNLAGVLGLLWAGYRLYAPTPALAWADGGGRLVVAVLMGYYVFWQGVTPVVLLFVVTELVGSYAQLRLLLRQRQ